MKKDYWLKDLETVFAKLIDPPFHWEELRVVIATLVNTAQQVFTGGSLKKQRVLQAIEYFDVIDRLEKAFNIPFIPRWIERKIVAWVINLLIEQAVTSLKLK